MPNYTHCPECEGCERAFRSWEELKDTLLSHTNTFGHHAGNLSRALRDAAKALFDLGEVDLSERCDDLDTDLDKAADRLENDLACAAFVVSQYHDLCEVHEEEAQS